MMSDYFLIFGSVSLSIAIIAAMRRSQIVLIVASLNMAVSSCIILLCALAQATGRDDPSIHAFIIIALTTLSNLIFCGVLILIFRSRGTLRLDDYREFRG